MATFPRAGGGPETDKRSAALAIAVVDAADGRLSSCSRVVPGGSLEPGESPPDAARRELNEERVSTRRRITCWAARR
jgi:8-oxo-dGTP pyrophosphatase MutT (NUDIX family)